jgi:hypothetical protein
MAFGTGGLVRVADGRSQVAHRPSRRVILAGPALTALKCLMEGGTAERYCPFPAILFVLLTRNVPHGPEVAGPIPCEWLPCSDEWPGLTFSVLAEGLARAMRLLYARPLRRGQLCRIDGSCIEVQTATRGF